jgi:hypothetical protein
MRCISIVLVTWLMTGVSCLTASAEERSVRPSIARFFAPPAEYAGDLGPYKSPLVFNDGRRVRSAEDWKERRREILDYWHAAMGPWPALLEKPRVEFVSKEQREEFTQHKVRIEVARDVMQEGYLLVPNSPGKHGAVFVPFYEPETSIGIHPDNKLRDFAYQLTKRGFVTLSIGSPNDDARKPDTSKVRCQPLSYLGYIAANCHTFLAQLPEVDAGRIGVVGHSYGGKWALFASCLYEKFAAAVWCDPGIVFDEGRANVNYWEPWYLGREAGAARKPGVVTKENPRTGAYKTLFESGRDLHELHVLMCPRPFMVSGGSEDPPLRWQALNHSVAVNGLLGVKDRVGMTNRAAHSPTEESNGQIYAFFEHFLDSQRPR